MRAIVVGAGPAGSTAAAHLAAGGVETLVLEKAHFPREKVCGDGLTPRAVKELQRLGIRHHGPGWMQVKGLRLRARGKAVEVPWPTLASFPDYGLVRSRYGFDNDLAEHAAATGATIRFGQSVTEMHRDDAGRVTGVRANRVDDRGRKTGDTEDFTADVVLVADGNSSPAAKSAGLLRRADRPLGVAARTYYTSPLQDMPWMEGWLQLEGPRGPLPGYGWIFGMGDGTCNVGLGVLNSSADVSGLDARGTLARWVGALPPEWNLDADHQQGPIRGSALPMGFNRTPHYQPGMVLLGDAGGMVSPFNGEGISYAMESGRLAAERIAAAALVGTHRTLDAALHGYADQLRTEWGKHFTLGRAFAVLIAKPRIMDLALRAGVSVPGLLALVAPMMANLTDREGAHRRAAGWLLQLLENLVPATGNEQVRLKR